MGDLQPIIYVVAWQGCGIGTFVVNLDLDCGRSAYFVVFLSRLDCAGGFFGYRQS
jgi:hypothetical protein